MNSQIVACAAVFILAYILLIPGLTCLLFSAKASFMGVEAFNIQKSTIEAIRMLNEKERYGAAGTILVCSVLGPFIKLAIMLTSAYFMWRYEQPGSWVNSMIVGIRRVSKWAAVDAFTASIFVGLFSGVEGVTVNLHRGFFCFMGYCILSVVGALLLGKPDKEAISEQRSLIIGGFSSKRTLLPSIAGLLMAIGVFVTWRYPLLHMNILIHQEDVAFTTIVERIWSKESRVAAVAFVALAFVIPMADLVCAMVEAFTGNVHRHVGEFLQDFAMLDVFALSVLVVSNAASGVNSFVSITILPAGWFVCVCSFVWLIYSLFMRSQPMPRMFPSKDKFGQGIDIAHKA
jgi:uncharacterized paraquat-inducible protein A|mmetsp:Transcript_57554/g.91266  ORF Transcript_57554/g.91266 Transcript_57554/m.91266 type:complete len:345 (+) Transcript_57554:93-1127(+)